MTRSPLIYLSAPAGPPLSVHRRWPQLRAALTDDERFDLYRAITREYRSGSLPTRPHPEGPSGPMGASLTQPIVGLIDKAVDAITGRSTTASGQPPAGSGNA
jgi:hypothetical protein